jgi:hypothetical protein
MKVNTVMFMVMFFGGAGTMFGFLDFKRLKHAYRNSQREEKV